MRSIVTSVEHRLQCRVGSSHKANAFEAESMCRCLVGKENYTARAATNCRVAPNETVHSNPNCVSCISPSGRWRDAGTRRHEQRPSTYNAAKVWLHLRTHVNHRLAENMVRKTKHNIKIKIVSMNTRQWLMLKYQVVFTLIALRCPWFNCRSRVNVSYPIMLWLFSLRKLFVFEKRNMSNYHELNYTKWKV